MDFLVTCKSDEMNEDELVKEFLEYRYQKYPGRYNSYKNIDKNASEISGVIYEKVPRDAINYMDVDSYYGITETVTEWKDSATTEIFNKYKIEKIKEIILNGGRNADLSEESLVSSAEERARHGPGLLCDFAIEHDYGIKIFE